MFAQRITIRRAAEKDAGAATELAAMLWPGHTLENIRGEMIATYLEPEEAVIFLADAGNSPVTANSKIRIA